jgi:hypothetical protein
MSAAQAEAARPPIMLAELRRPTVHRLWPAFAERADKEGWPAARFLATLVEHELAERVTRRIERHRLESRLPPEKTLATFDFAAVPKVRKAHILALAAGDSWLEKGVNILVFRPPGVGAQRVAVVGIHIARRDQQGAKADYLGEPMVHPLGRPRVLDAACQPVGDPELALDLGQYQNPGIRGQPPAVEGNVNRLAAGW